MSTPATWIAELKTALESTGAHVYDRSYDSVEMLGTLQPKAICVALQSWEVDDSGPDGRMLLLGECTASVDIAVEGSTPATTAISLLTDTVKVLRATDVDGRQIKVQSWSLAEAETNTTTRYTITITFPTVETLT